MICLRAVVVATRQPNASVQGRLITTVIGSCKSSSGRAVRSTLFNRKSSSHRCTPCDSQIIERTTPHARPPPPPLLLHGKTDILSWVGSSNLDKDRKQRQRRHLQPLPLISLVAPVHSRGACWMSTDGGTAAAAAAASKDAAATSPSGCKGHGSSSYTLRDRARDIRSNVSERAHQMGDKASEQYREFKRHPKESAVQGAKSAGGMVARYGPVFVGTYLSVYGLTLLSFFAGVQSGVMDPVTLFSVIGAHAQDAAAATGETSSTVQLVVDWMQNHSFTEPYAIYVEKNPAVANLVVAWIAVKFTEPVRLAVSVAITPRISRYFGFSPPKEEDHGEDDGTESEAAPAESEVHPEIDNDKKK